MTPEQRFWTCCADKPGLWLVGVTDGQIVTWDGPHGDPQGVAKARRLLHELGLDRGLKRTYRMVRIDAVPEHTGDIDAEAVRILRPLIDRPRETRPGYTGHYHEDR